MEAAWPSGQHVGLSIQWSEFCSDRNIDLFHGSPKFRSVAMLVNSQLVCLQQVEILNHVMNNLNYLFQLFARLGVN